MKLILTCAIIIALSSASASSQDSGTPSGSGPPTGHRPPPHAYTDCQSKHAGDRVQHRTREGTVSATCMDSPEGLVARPDQPPNMKADQRPSPDADPQRNERRPPSPPGRDRPGDPQT